MSATNPSTTVADYLAERLAELGAEHLFAVPGDYIAPFLDAVDRLQRPIRVAVANELEAGYAADGYARYQPLAAVAVTYGVGAYSALSAVAGSYVERLPVVVINGSPSHANRRLGSDLAVLFHHDTGDLDANLEAFRRVTVAAEVLNSGLEAPEKIDRALRAAITHKRPVYIEGLKDIWDAPCAVAAGEKLKTDVAPSDPLRLAEAVNAAWSLMARSSRGVIWAGIELRRLGLEPLLEKLLEASGWGLMTTLLAKGLISEVDRRFRGVYAGPASPEEVRDELEGSDAILALGTLITDDYLDLLAVAYDHMVVGYDGAVRVGSRFFPRVALEDFARGVLDRFHEAGPATRCPLPYKWTVSPARPPKSARVTFERLLAKVGEFLEENMVLIVDESCAMYASASMCIKNSGGFVAQAAYGSIGYAVAGAIGVGLATNSRPIVVNGDGGFQMTCQALSTLQLNKRGAVVLIVDNGVYGIEQALVDLRPFDKRTGSFRPYNILPAWDYTALAESMGGEGVTVGTVAELDAALGQAKRRTKTVSVIAVKVDRHNVPDEIRRLAEDTGFPRHEHCSHVGRHREDFLVRIARRRRSSL